MSKEKLRLGVMRRMARSDSSRRSSPSTSKCWVASRVVRDGRRLVDRHPVAARIVRALDRKLNLQLATTTSMTIYRSE